MEEWEAIKEEKEKEKKLLMSSHSRFTHDDL